MMEGRMASYCIDGTAAIKPIATERASAQTTIIPFPRNAVSGDKRFTVGRALEAAKHSARNALYSSEMYCSLKFEDFRGCGYGMFTRKGIAALSTASAAIAILSIAMGA